MRAGSPREQWPGCGGLRGTGLSRAAALLIALALALPAVSGCAPPAAERRPPLVLVTLDTTRRDALGPYGARDGLTPVLDHFAERATVFAHAHAVAPWTLPAHASLFTGLYPSHHGAGVRSGELPAAAQTLAELLGDAGYATAGFAGGVLCGPRYGVAQGFDRYQSPAETATPGDQLVDAVAATLRERSSAPLFLFVNLFDAHAPYHAPAPWAERAGATAHHGAMGASPYWRNVARGRPLAWARLMRGEAPAPPPAVLTYLQAAYRAEIAFTDAQLGRLFELLSERGLWDDALVAVVADHGELLGEGGWWGHGYRLDPQLVEVPLLVKWPRQRRSERRTGVVSQIDLFPTLLAAAGITPPASDGHPLPPPGERAPRSPSRSRVIAEEHLLPGVHPLPWEAMRVAPSLYGVLGPHRRQLLWTGGQECARRAAAGWVRTRCASAESTALGALLRELGPPPSGGTAAPLEESARRELRALGYL